MVKEYKKRNLLPFEDDVKNNDNNSDNNTNNEKLVATNEESSVNNRNNISFIHNYSDFIDVGDDYVFSSLDFKNFIKNNNLN